MNFRALFLVTVGLAAALMFSSSARAETKPLTLRFVNGAVKEVSAVEQAGVVWVDFFSIAAQCGAVRRHKNRVEIFDFPTHTVAINPIEASYSIREHDSKRWLNDTFQEPVIAHSKALMIPLADLPRLLHQSLTYDQLKRTVSVRVDDVNYNGGRFRILSLPFQSRDRQIWVALEELTKALTIVMYSDGPRTFKLVMRDFSVVELKVGDNYTYRRNTPDVELEDPILLFAGKPYISVRSISGLFEIEPRWDPARKSLLLPTNAVHAVDRKLSQNYQLVVQGHTPTPFHLKIDELSAFYQNPAPSYAFDNRNIYESVRNFLTNDPIVGKNQGWNRVSGSSVLNMTGNTAGIPMEGRAAFEKVGGTSRLVSGTAKWGFPNFQISGGRDYITMGGLNNQFSIVDAVSVSHSNDHYGDHDTNPIVKMEAGYGEAGFSVFQSTALFSQNAVYQQRYGVASLTSDWSLDNGRSFGVTAQNYYVQNDVQKLDSTFNDAELIRDIFGDGAEITVDPKDAEALLRTALTDRHNTSLLGLNYSNSGKLDLSATGALSTFKDIDGKSRADTDWQVRSVMRHKRNRLELSYERAGDKYRAIGNPLLYQSRKIFRSGASLDLARFWNILGDYRNEETGVLKSQGIAPYRNTYVNGTNIFHFHSNAIRGSVTQFNSGLYGKRRTHAENYTQYLGRHSVDVGVSNTKQWTASHLLFRDSHGGKIGFQLVGTGWQFSCSEEYTRHNYPGNSLQRVESLATSVVEIKKWQLLVEHHKETKYFLTEDYLHTGYLRLGRTIGKDRIFGVFGAISSLNGNFSHPEVWRTGIEYSLNFY